MGTRLHLQWCPCSAAQSNSRGTRKNISGHDICGSSVHCCQDQPKHQTHKAVPAPHLGYLWGPYNKEYSIISWGLYWGPPIYGNYHIATLQAPRCITYLVHAKKHYQQDTAFEHLLEIRQAVILGVGAIVKQHCRAVVVDSLQQH